MDTINNDIRQSTTWSIVLSILMVVSGVAAIIVPAAAGLAVTAMFGWLLIFTGALHLGMAWRSQGASAIFGEIAISLLYAVVGFYLLARPIAGVASLTIAVAVWLVVKGVIEAAVAFQVRPAPGSGWLVFNALLTIAVAALIAAAWPASTTWAIGVMVGVAMVSSGFTRLMISSAIRAMAA